MRGRANHLPPSAVCEPRILGERVRILYARAATAQATVVICAGVVAWIFRDMVPPARGLAWFATMCVLALARLSLARAYYQRSSRGDLEDASAWAHLFTAGAALTGLCWGSAAIVFYVPGSTVHQVFLVFALGGMTAGAASSNASFMPAFVAFAAPALLPMVVRLGADRDPVHAAMAFMLTLFVFGVAGTSRTGSRNLERAIRLRFQNETLVDDLTSARQRLEALNAELEQRIDERTHELQRSLALRVASEARLAVTLRSIGDAVIATDELGNVTVFNGVAEVLTGRRADQATGRLVDTVLLLLDEETLRPAAHPLARVLAEEIPLGPTRYVLVARDGRKLSVATTAAPIRSATGDLLGAIMVLRDQTKEHRAEEALRESEQQLRESDRLKGEFFALLSHELRNPLAPIRTSLYLLEHTPQDSAASARAREIIHRQTQHLARLVDDLLDVTRISQDKLELRRARVELGGVVRRACDDYQAAFLDRGIELRVEVSTLVWTHGDETRLAQVVSNLLHNAAKFGRRGGTVLVRVGAAGGQAEVRVRDDGAGIPPEVLPRVFQPFVQGGGDGLARTRGGLGLGLALVKRLVELHGGSVRAQSEGVDRGAEFIVTLPLAPAAEPVAPVPSASSPRGAISDVLIIEDNLDAAHSIADILLMEGHRVHVATDGRSGISLAQDHRPDIILCDIGLPDIDGYTVVRALRGDDRLSSTRFVALTGYAQPEDRQRAEEAGFHIHLAKPPPLDALLALVASSAREKPAAEDVG